jgi:Bacterial Ig-like domain (group 3)
VTLTATVSETDPAAPTGNVEFFDGATSLGTSPVSGAGVATKVVGPLTAGARTLKAVYAGDSAFATSQGTTPLTVTGAPPAASNTATVLTVNPASGPAYQSITFQGTVTDTTPPAVTPVGTCQFLDGPAVFGTAPVNGSGVCTFISASFAFPGHVFTAKFVPTDTAAFNPSTSNAVNADYAAPTTTPDDQTVVVTVPAGTLTVLTPYTPANPLNLGSMVLAGDGSSFSATAVFDKVTVTDTRAGNPGWTASLTRADFTGLAPADTIPAKYSGFTNVHGSYIAGNAIQLGDVAFSNIAANSPTYVPGPATFATTTAGNGTGTVDILANFVLEGVPTSTRPGLYTATVTFTVA